MRFAILAVIAIGCGGHAGPVTAPPPSAADLPATRWVPDRPAYLFASRNLGDAQRSLRDALDLLGTATGVDLRDVASMAQGLVGVDVLHADPLAAIGIDVAGSWAAFSEDMSPTVVVHLTAPDRMKTFLDHQRERGLVTQTVTVDATEVSSAALIGGITIHWAIAGDWMWIHLALPSSRGDATQWFTASHGAHGAAWSDSWAWAQRAANGAAGVVGFFDLHGAIANAAARLPDAVACTRLLPSVGRVAVSLQSDEHHIGARIAVEVGPTAGLRQHLLAAPVGWDATAAHAAVAAQWNLDLTAVRAWLSPCLAAAGTQLAALDDTGVRTARGMLLAFDPETTTGSGAVAFDLASPGFVERQLDRIPLRKSLERARAFGTHKGFSIEIPFSITVEYVLERELLIAALGEGIVAKLVAPTGPAGPAAPAGAAPIFALDVAPPAMSAEAWATVLQGLAQRGLPGAPGPAAKRAAERLLRWRAARVAVTAEASELVLTASGDRR